MQVALAREVPSQVHIDGQGYGALLSTWVLLTLSEEKRVSYVFWEVLKHVIPVYKDMIKKHFSGTPSHLIFT